MVVNFKVHKINRDTRKLIRIYINKKKSHRYISIPQK